MSALTDRIAEVLRAELSKLFNLTDEEWAAHVAERIEAELRFTEETRHLEDGSGGISTNWKTGVTTSHCKPATGVRRWVSAWSEVS